MKIPPFPWRKHTKKELVNEFERLRLVLQEKGSYTRPLKFSKVGYKCTNFFFQKVRLKTRAQNKMSSYDYWIKNHKKIIKWNSQYKHDLFRGVSFLSHPPAHFPIYIAGRILTMFPGVKTIFDPYAGWGDRCLATMALDLNYIGIDSNTKLKEPYRRMISFFSDYSSSKVKMYFGKSENVKLRPKEEDSIDLVFSSPPFWDEANSHLLEEYTGTDRDYNKFMKNSLVPMVKKYLRKGKWVCLYIPSNMYKDLAKEVGKANKRIAFATPSNNLQKNYHGKSVKNIVYCFKNEI